eukprot:2230774-Pyramimonas_sp.AAC.3
MKYKRPIVKSLGGSSHHTFQTPCKPPPLALYPKNSSFASAKKSMPDPPLRSRLCTARVGAKNVGARCREMRYQ